MATLYELTGLYRDLLEMSDGDEQLFKDTVDSLDLNKDIEAKADGYVKLILELESEAKRYSEEAERLNRHYTTLINRVKNLKEHLYNGMNEAQLTEIPNQLFKIKIQKNGGLAPVVIKEGVEIPEEYFKVVKEVDNYKIREVLKTQKLDFAELGERGTHLSIK